MERTILADLKEWKKSCDRKPLLLLGARQTGKTWILKEFGRISFKNTRYFDFSEQNSSLSLVFSGNLDPDRILKDLEIFLEESIDLLNDLIIFDEIQEEPSALKSLKYFHEKRPEVTLVAAGSLLGVSLSSESFPVGKVNYLKMYPLSFHEFLRETAKEMLFHEYEKALQTHQSSSLLHSRLMGHLRDYWITGGLPAAVNAYMGNRENQLAAYSAARTVQNNLLKDYLNDFGKHAGKLNSNHIRYVFENIPLQLASFVDDSVKRYIFKDIIPGKKGFSPVEGPLAWLEQAGLVYKVPVCNRAEIPLKAFTKPNMFKLHLFDIGLMGAMLELSPKTILENSYGITKGFFAESFVMAELKKSITTGIYSWTERNSEIEFMIYSDDSIIPIEVKAGNRTKAKSLATYLTKYTSDPALKLMDCPLQPRGKSPIWNIPLYLSGRIPDLLKELPTNSG
ncbi:MAG: hypothetical protein B6241_09630 [Spirochaetaceae bacterium 4572_59]|nr:MAG: hypothetical protein B6241_09630 [Spirochaetaceae bacterium 4572_59]